MNKEEDKKQKWDIINFLEANPNLSVGKCLVKYSDQQNQSLQKQLEEVNGIETSKSTHRCSYCEDFYADEENPLDEYNSGLTCNKCLTEILNEDNKELTFDLKNSTKEITNLKQQIKQLEEDKDRLEQRLTVNGL